MNPIISWHLLIHWDHYLALSGAPIDKTCFLIIHAWDVMKRGENGKKITVNSRQPKDYAGCLFTLNLCVPSLIFLLIILSVIMLHVEERGCFKL